MDPQDKERVREQSMGELMKRLQHDLSNLMGTEKALLRKELSTKADELKRTGAEFGTAAVVGLLGAMTLVAAVVLLLATVMVAWLAALIVGVVLAAIGGALAMKAKSNVEDFNPTLERATRNIRRDAQAVKEAVR